MRVSKRQDQREGDRENDSQKETAEKFIITMISRVDKTIHPKESKDTTEVNYSSQTQLQIEFIQNVFDLFGTSIKGSMDLYIKPIYMRYLPSWNVTDGLILRRR